LFQNDTEKRGLKHKKEKRKRFDGVKKERMGKHNGSKDEIEAKLRPSWRSLGLAI